MTSMNDQRYLRRHQEELSENKAVITPICIVVDRSASMKMPQFVDEFGKTRMERLNEGIRLFINEIKKDEMLSDSVEISIVGFTDDREDDLEFPPVETILNFSTIDNIHSINITASNRSGDTPLGVEAALKLLDDEKQFLKDNKSKYNQPWIVIFSDGRATPSSKWKRPNSNSKDYSDINFRLRRCQRKTRELEANKKLTVIPVLISEPGDGEFEEGYRQMKGFSAEKRALVLSKSNKYNPNNLSFSDFFKILSKSVSVSNADLMFSQNENNRKQSRKIESYNDYTRDDISKAEYHEQDKLNAIIASKVNINIRIIIYLPKPLDKDECLKVACKSLRQEIYSDSSDYLSIDADVAILTLQLKQTIDNVHLIIELCQKGSHRCISQLDNSSYNLNGDVLTIDISNKEKRKEIEKLKQEAMVSDNHIAIVNDITDDSHEEKTEKSIENTKKSVDTSIADDDYLNNLLNGIDDWDNI